MEQATHVGNRSTQRTEGLASDRSLWGHYPQVESIVQRWFKDVCRTQLRRPERRTVFGPRCERVLGTPVVPRLRQRQDTEVRREDITEHFGAIQRWKRWRLRHRPLWLEYWRGLRRERIQAIRRVIPCQQTYAWRQLESRGMKRRQDIPSGRGGTGGTSGTDRVGLRDGEAEKCEELERSRECPGRDATRNSFGDSTSISCFCDMCWRKATGRRMLRAPSSQHLVDMRGMRV
jgi:hypothetical protein